MIEIAELQDAAERAFPADDLTHDAAQSWNLISEMGWLMLMAPEERGGLGLGNDALITIHCALGRALFPGPAIAQMLAIEGICAAQATPDNEAHLQGAMAGERIAVSMALHGPSWEGGKLTGTMEAIADADLASHLLVIAEGRKLCALVPLGDAAVTIDPTPTWDETRRMFRVRLDGFQPNAAQIIADGDAVSAIALRMKQMLLLALAADSLGGADAILRRTVDYLGTRRQFDRPLAMFQALKHRVADCKAHLAAAEALLVQRAAEASGLVQLGALKSHACAVYVEIAEEAVQLHGGIGLTAEYPCHLFLKRAMLNAALGGDADYWDEQAGKALLNGEII